MPDELVNVILLSVLLLKKKDVEKWKYILDQVGKEFLNQKVSLKLMYN
jgi:hypothetical protein